MRAFDAIVLGAGIVGAACAMELAEAGMRVAIVEPGVVGGGATAAGMGHVVVMDDSPAQLALTLYGQQLWQQCAAHLPAAAEYESAGTLWVARNPDEAAEAERKQQTLHAQGIASEWLDANQLQREEPNLRRDLIGGLLVSRDVVLYPPVAAGFFLERACTNGATLLCDRAVTAAQGTVALGSGERLTAPHTVHALGADATLLIPELPVKKRKGHLAITDRAPGFLRHQLIELGYTQSAGSGTADSVAFNVQPRRTGQILIGSSRQYDAETTEIDRAILSNMLERTLAFLPAIERLSILRVWTGFRAATPDKLPLIGPLPTDPTQILATGHEGLGITTALATAKLVSGFLTGTERPIALDPYLPARLLAASHSAQAEQAHG